MISHWFQISVRPVEYLVFAYFISLNALYAFLIFFSSKWCREYKRKSVAHPIDFEALKPLEDMVPPVTIIVPAYNEERVIVQSVRSFLSMAYKRTEVVVVNDGSKDGTLDELIRSFSLRRVEVCPGAELPTRPVRGFYVSTVEPRLVVVDKENGGSKADALNAGINFSQSPYFLALDADSLVEPEALTYAMRAVFEDPDHVVGVAGIVRGVNGSIVDGGRVRVPYLSINFWVLMQAIEYLRSFLAGRAGWAQINGLIIIPGAFGLFQKAACVRAGGYNPVTVTEDLDLGVRLHRYSRDHKLGWRLLFAPDAVCWTEMPNSAKVLSSQRQRWHAGLWQNIAKQWGMTFRPRYGVVGMLAMPHQVFHELGGPMVELSGLLLMSLFYVLGMLNWKTFALYMALAFFIGIVFSMLAILIDQTNFPRHRYPRDAVLLLLFSLIEYFGYRQIFLWWRLKASWTFLFGRVTWTATARTGFATRAIENAGPRT